MPELSPDDLFRGLDPEVKKQFQGELARQKNFLDQVKPRVVTGPDSIIGPTVLTPRPRQISNTRPGQLPGEVTLKELQTRARLNADPGQTSGILRQAGVSGFRQALHWLDDADEAFKVTTGRIPDKEAKIQFYAKLLPEGLGEDFVRDNFVAVERDFLFRDFRELAKNSKSLGEWASNPNNMVLAWDSGRQLSALKNVLVSRYGGVFEHVGVGFENAIESPKKGVLGTLKIADDIGAWLDVKRLEIFEGEEFTPEEEVAHNKRMSHIANTYFLSLLGSADAQKEMARLDRMSASEIDTYLAGRQDVLSAAIRTSRENAAVLTDEVGGFYRFSVDLPGSAADLLSKVVMGMANPAIPLGLIAVQEGGGLYGDLRDQGVSSLTALATAVPVAAVNTLLERAQLKNVSNILGLRKRLSKEAMSGVIGALLVDVVENIGQETLQNMVTTAGSLAARTEIEDTTIKKALNELAGSFKEGLYEGLLVGTTSAILGIGSVSAGMRRIGLNARQRAALGEISKVIEETPLYARDPAKLQEAVDAMLRGEDAAKVIRDVGVDAETFQQVVPEAVLDETLAALGIDGETFQQALVENEEMRFTIGAWATVAPTQVGTELFNHLRFGVDGMTVVEQGQALKFETELATDRALIVRDMLTTTPAGMTSEQKMDFRRQFEETGMPKHFAREYVETLDRVLKRGAQIKGTTAQELAERITFTVDATDPGSVIEQGEVFQQRAVEDVKAAVAARGVEGDALENAVDLATELQEKGGFITEDGEAVLFHRTSKANADRIVQEQKMFGKEDGLFFGTKTAGQISGFGEATLRVSLPLEELQLDDVFDDEAHVRLPVAVGARVGVAVSRVDDEEAREGRGQQGVTGIIGLSPLGFYSSLERAVVDIDFKQIPGDQLLARLKKTSGVKQAELEDSGLEDWLKVAESKVTKEDVLEVIEKGGIVLEEVVKGAPVFLGLSPEESVEFAALNKIPLADMTSEQENRFDVLAGKNAETEARKGGSPADVRKFANYVLPGGENYQEVLLTVPEELGKIQQAVNAFVLRMQNKYVSASWRQKMTTEEEAELQRLEAAFVASKEEEVQPFLSPHWDEANVLVHLRMNDREIDDEDALFLEELQSDWHQEGRRQGYRRTISVEGFRVSEGSAEKGYMEVVDAKGRFVTNVTEIDLPNLTATAAVAEAQRRVSEEPWRTGTQLAVADAPFKKTESWAMLAFKRALAIAVAENKQVIAWTPGEVQAARYDLSQQISKITYAKTEEGMYSITPFSLTGDRLEGFDRAYSESELAGVIGKEAADKVVKNVGHKPGEPAGAGTLSGLDLKVGGEGMVAFYDKVLPKAVQKYVKKLDKSAKVGTAQIETQKVDPVAGDDINIRDPIFLTQEEAERHLANGNAISGFPIDAIETTVIEPNSSEAESLEDYSRLWLDPFQAVDAGVTTSTVAGEKISQEVWALPITDKMVEVVKGGQSFYQQTRGAVTFTGEDIEVKLFKGNWDTSTPVHELGHIALKFMQEAVAAGNTDEQLLRDFDTLKKFAGTDLSGDLGAEGVAGVEKIIDQWEGYFLEGKAPAVELAESFARFKNWMLDVYKDITAKLGGEEGVAPELRQVFGAWIATENEIETAETYYRTYEVASDILLKEKDAKIAQVKVKIEDEKEKQIREAVKIRLKEWRDQTGGREGILAQATAEVDALPIYQALNDAIELGGISQNDLAAFFTGSDLEQLIGTLRAQHGQSVVAEEVETKVDDSLDAFLDWMTNTDRENELDVLASRHGFGDTRTMVLGMEEAPGRSEAINTRANEIEARHARNVKADVESEVGATHNTSTLDLIQRDIGKMEALARGRQSAQLRRAKLKALRDQTREELRTELIVRDALQYRRWAAREAEYARLAISAAQRGDREGALDARRKQLKFHATILESVKLREEYEKITRSLSGKTINSRLKNAQPDYARAVKDLVFTYRANDTTVPESGGFVIQVEAVAGQTVYHLVDKKEDTQLGTFPTRGRAVAAWRGLIRQQPLELPTLGLTEKDDADLQGILVDLDDVVPTWVKEKVVPAGYTNMKDLTFEQVEELNASIQMLIQEGGHFLTALKALGDQRIGELLTKIEGRMEKLPDFHKGKRDSGTLLGKASAVTDKFAAYMQKMEFLFDAMDGFASLKGEKGGPSSRIYDLVSLADANYDNIVAKHMEGDKAAGIPGLQQAYVRLAKAAEKVTAKQGEFFDVKGVPIPDALRQIKGWEAWTFERVLAVVFNMGNDANRGPLQKSVYQFTDLQLDALASVLPADALRAVQDVWDSIDVYDELARVTENVTFKRPPQEESMPFEAVSSEGERVAMKGGYYPLRYDSDLDPDAGRWNERANIVADLYNRSTHQSARPDSTASKARVRDERTGESLSTRPPDLSLGVLVDRFTKTVRQITHMELLYDIQRLTTNKEFFESFVKKFGLAQYKAMRQWLNRSARPERRIQGPMNRAVESLRSLHTVSALGLRVLTSSKQALSAAGAVQAMNDSAQNKSGYKYLTFGASTLLTGDETLGESPGEIIKFILKVDPFMRARNKSITREMRDFARRIDFAKGGYLNKIKRTKQWAQEVSFIGIRAVDAVTVYTVWLGAYKQALELGLEGVAEATTEEEAMEAAVRYARRIVRTTQPSGLPSDQSALQAEEGIARMLTQFMSFKSVDFNRFMHRVSGIKKGQISASTLAGYIFNERLIPAMAMLLPAFILYNEDEKPKWWEFMIQPGTDLLAGVPLLNQTISALKFGRASELPILQGVSQANRALNKLRQGKIGEGAFETWRTMEWFMGTPFSNPVHDARRLFKKIKEK